MMGTIKRDVKNVAGIIRYSGDVDDAYSANNEEVAFFASRYQNEHNPSSAWYFIMSYRAESTFITQMAFGMTGTGGVYYRMYNIGDVGTAWTKIV